MQYNKPLLAALLGALSTISSEIVSRILLFIGIGTYSIYQLESLLITLNRPNAFLGFYLDCIIGGVVGIIFYYSIKFLGEDYLVYKSIFVGLLASALSELLISIFIEDKYIPIRPIEDYFLHIFCAMIFGLTLGILFNNYLFKKTQRA